MNTLLIIVMSLVFLKSVFIGSDFSFYHWCRDGKKYTDWYKNRPKYRGV